MLAAATIFWGLSFPIMKSLALLQQQLVPGISSWFSSSVIVIARFGISAFLIGLVCLPTIRKLTTLEISQGVGLGLFGSLGLIFQMDGLNYTHASTSAFLTQAYVAILPFIAAVRERRAPSGRVLVCTVLMIVGIAILNRTDPRNLRLGRGELETLIGSFFFTGQILWLERPIYAKNNVNHFSFIMFLVTAAVAAPLAFATMNKPSDFVQSFNALPVLVLVLALVLFCTMTAYMMMNRWQPHVTATEAGLLYCIEPVFASLFALFLPALISAAANIDYANETITWTLLTGGSVIIAANVLLQLKPPAKTVAPA